MTQRWRPVPAGQTPILVIDATSADETYVLPAARPGHTIEIRRIDSSMHTATLGTQPGWTIDGAASITIGPSGQALLEVTAADMWESYSPGADLSTVTAQLSTSYVPQLTAPTTLTYNPDGTVASQTLGGIATTYTYNPDGTVASETRNGITRTYTYNIDGTLASVS